MREYDSHFDAYEHLGGHPRGDEALHMLRKLASMVKPIMRKRGWKVGVLCEFLPPEANLMGLNINRGERICVRLRHHFAPSQFLHLEQVVDTLLHELSHIVWGPHDHKFQTLWDELRDEHETLLMKGFTGEGFLSKGHKLGGQRVPLSELRRKARAEAEKRAARGKLAKNSGRKLGGAAAPPPPPAALPGARGGNGMRGVIADAVTRRNNITSGCASGTQDAERMAREAQRNGFRTKAEEDDANDRAIANALIELMEQEEERKLAAGTDGGASSGWEGLQDGLSWSPDTGLRFTPSPAPSPAFSSPPPPRPAPSPDVIDLTSSPRGSPRRTLDARPARPVSRLVSEENARRQRQVPATGSVSSRNEGKQVVPGTTPVPTRIEERQPIQERVWPCVMCTLENPWVLSYCDACGSAKPDSKPPWWRCLQCGTFMENHYWTCSACGLMKASS